MSILNPFKKDKKGPTKSADEPAVEPPVSGGGAVPSIPRERQDRQRGPVEEVIAKRMRQLGKKLVCGCSVLNVANRAAKVVMEIAAELFISKDTVHTPLRAQSRSTTTRGRPSKPCPRWKEHTESWKSSSERTDLWM